MFTLTRISTVPASPLRVVVSQPEGDSAGLNVGGSFYFQPAPTPGTNDPHRTPGDHQAGMSEHAARTILGDPGLAPHFRCDPPLPSTRAAATEAPTSAPKGRPAPKSPPAVDPAKGSPAREGDR